MERGPKRRVVAGRGVRDRLWRCRIRPAAVRADRCVVGSVRGLLAGERVPSSKGPRNHVGRWSTATTGDLVGYELWLQRDRLTLLDFDPGVLGVAAQPFWANVGRQASLTRTGLLRPLCGRWSAGDGLPTPADRIKPRGADAFTATCAAHVVGVSEVVGGRDQVTVDAVRRTLGHRPAARSAADITGGPTPPVAVCREDPSGFFGQLLASSSRLPGASRPRRAVVASRGTTSACRRR